MTASERTLLGINTLFCVSGIIHRMEGNDPVLVGAAILLGFQGLWYSFKGLSQQFKTTFLAGRP